MGSMRLVCSICSLFVVASQAANTNEDLKGALKDACEVDFNNPSIPRDGLPSLSVDSCKEVFDELPEDINEETWFTGTNVLMMAATWGWEEVSKVLIAAGADVNNINNNWGQKETALLDAARYGRPKVCEILISAGADINHKNGFGYGETPLELAIKYNHGDVVDVLEKHGATVPEFGLDQILQFHGISSSEINEPDNREEIGPNVKANTPLTYAVLHGNKEAVELLRGITPLTFAALIGNKKAVELLLEAGADVDIPQMGHYELTPLMLAVEQQFPEICQILIDAGADIEKRDINQNTALIKAAEGDNVDIVRMLISTGADLDKRNVIQGTALYEAAYNENRDIVRILIEAGADTSIRPIRVLWKTPQNMRFIAQLEEEVNSNKA